MQILKPSNPDAVVASTRIATIKSHEFFIGQAKIAKSYNDFVDYILSSIGKFEKARDAILRLNELYQSHWAEVCKEKIIAYERCLEAIHQDSNIILMAIERNSQKGYADKLYSEDAYQNFCKYTRYLDELNAEADLFLAEFDAFLLEKTAKPKSSFWKSLCSLFSVSDVQSAEQQSKIEDQKKEEATHAFDFIRTYINSFTGAYYGTKQVISISLSR